ncbi:ALWAYS EARLY 2 [Rhynchospora pubera]|uniref:ALWAYS EARLY 2 n=1 Tax=Rhynchospora pubera TaxID=906938 RepID=A0AAV8G0X2_9POAL|nr:ALWAYS EARLY 2 [Rhynchospora pubera]
MASTRKGRKVHKKFAKVNEDWPEKERPSTANKSKNKKKKLVDLLGPQWSKEELECFYDAYRKYGKDWKKVSGSVRNRTADMVESLYNMNRAYLSLPEGAATAAGLIAMMTDHYSNLEGSNSENEDNELLKMGPAKPPLKRGKSKQKTESKASKSRYPDLLSYEPASSSFAALSAIKKKRSGDILAGTRPRAVGKRTPRVAVTMIQNRGNNRLDSPSTTVKPDDDEGAHVAAMALAEVFQRGGSPQVSHTPSKYAATFKAGDKKNAESERDSSKAVAFHAEGEGSLGSREAENKDSHKDPYTPGKGVSAVGSKTPKLKKSQKTRQKGMNASKSEDDKEACSGTEEGHHSSSGKGLRDPDDGDAKSPWASTSSRKRSRQLSFGVSDDEAGALSALHTLADLSVNILQPTPIAESESSAQGKDDDQEIDSTEKESKSKASSKKDKRKADGVGPEGSARKKTKVAKESATPDSKDSTLKTEKAKKCKPTPSKIRKDEAKNEIEKAEVSVGEEKLGRHPIQASPVSKPAGEFVNPVELSPSISGPARVAIDVSGTSTTGNPTQFQTKSKSRRKCGIVKAFSKREIWRSEKTANKRPSYLPNSAVDLKDKLSHCLSNSLFRRWCRFEWFYSAIDYPWFAQNEFVEYLNHVKLGHIPRLTREEWGVIRGSLGKPRRLSAFFLNEERVKLAKYRQSVREHYSSLLTGKLRGLPTDLARPLTVGQRVISCHPKSRELHDGSVLTVDGDRCRVQFDRPELGVEFVLDIDCMPSNPMENMPEALRRQNVYASKFGDSNFAVQANDWRAGVPTRVGQSSEGLGGPSRTATSYPMSMLSQQAKGDSIDSVAQAKATLNEGTIVARQAMYDQSSTMSQIQEREADIRALAELSRTLDKKEALVMELRYMNEEVSGKQKETDNLSDLEHFRNQYATVLVQLREANDQVASALLTLRDRNTYNVNPANPLPRSTETYGAPSDSLNHAGFNNSLETGTQVVEIIENSRRKAKMMVDAAVQVMCTTSDGENPHVKIREALDSLSSRNFGSGSSILGIRRIPPDSGHANSTYQHENATSATFDPSAMHVESPKMHVGFEGEVRLPSELISSCVSTLLMIQSCTEKQQPPAEVAHILDSALASMQPCCPDNAGLYRDIETCMGIIMNQMLALIPTPATIPASVSMPSELWFK